MKKIPVCLFVLILAAVSLLAPALTLPALACGAGSSCCQSACNCGMNNQAQAPAPLASAPIVANASFDPSLASYVNAIDVPQTEQSNISSGSSPSDERSEKDKLYDAQSNLRL